MKGFSMLKLASVLFVLGCSMGVSQASVFIGGTYGASWGGIKNSSYDHMTNNENFENSLSNAATAGFRVGADFEQIRVYGTYDRASRYANGGDNTMENLLLSTDYLYRVSPSTRVFIGVTAGANHMVNEGADYYDHEYDAYSYAYGGQFGAVADLRNGFEFEAAYRYLIHNSIDHDSDYSNDEFPQLKSSQYVYFGLNYHF